MKVHVDAVVPSLDAVCTVHRDGGGLQFIQNAMQDQSAETRHRRYLGGELRWVEAGAWPAFLGHCHGAGCQKERERHVGLLLTLNLDLIK